MTPPEVMTCSRRRTVRGEESQSQCPHLVAGHTLGGELVLIAGRAVNVVLLRDE